MSRSAADAVPWGGWSPAVRDDPFPHFAAVRASSPVQHVRLADGTGAWLVLSHDAARQALSDPRLSKDMVAALGDAPGVVAEGLPGPALSRHMLNVDPPDHTRLRRLAARGLAPTRVAALEESVQEIADALLDALAERGPDDVVDLVAGFARPLPFRVIGRLLGVPETDDADIHDWFRALLAPWVGEPPASAVVASDNIVRYLRELIEARRHAPAEDMTSVLVSAADDQGELSEQELVSSLFQLVVAGHDTTTSLIGNGVVALLDHPDQKVALQRDPGLLPAMVEELTRFTAPVPHATFRMTTEPVQIGGTLIERHQQVLVCLAAANRDPEHFDNADTFDPSRDRRQHLGFGHGIHYCLGAPLARLEARVAFGTLLRRFPALRLGTRRDGLAWTHGDGVVLRGLEALPVVLGPPGG